MAMPTTCLSPTTDESNQTVEDWEARAMPDMTLQHADTTFEFVQYQFSVRKPMTLTNFRETVVIRLSQTSTKVTVALED